MHKLKDYSTQKLALTPDYEGEVIATLISLKANLGKRKAILYLHGYLDYFFQEHLGEAFNARAFDFYALDLRKYGRSLLAHQHPNYCRSISEYYEEIDTAIRQISRSSNGEVYLMGHSTGGLIASNYMNYGKEKDLVKALLLNSPFLGFNLNRPVKTIIKVAARPIAAMFPYARVKGALSPAYVKSIHKDFHGIWNFNLDWKPLEGFATYFAWLAAIEKAHQSLKRSNIKVPILILHSHASSKYSDFKEEAMRKDIVLDVDDIKRIGAKLGSNVSLLEIENAKHDVFLSNSLVRTEAFKEMFKWLAAL